MKCTQRQSLKSCFCENPSGDASCCHPPHMTWHGHVWEGSTCSRPLMPQQHVGLAGNLLPRTQPKAEHPLEKTHWIKIKLAPCRTPAHVVQAWLSTASLEGRALPFTSVIPPKASVLSLDSLCFSRNPIPDCKKLCKGNTNMSQVSAQGDF